MRTICILTLAVLLSACGGKQSQQQDAPAAKARPTTFVFPEIPEMLTAPGQRLSYLLHHYWEEFDFADTTLLATPDVAEQGFVNFIGLLPRATDADRRAAIDSLVRLSSPHPKALAYVLEQAEKYLYDPNSPMRDEDAYVALTSPYLASPAIGFADKSRLEFRIRMASMNRPGDPATDFRYIVYPKGNASSLRATPARQLLLVFYDPECEGCQETLAGLMQSELLAAKTADGSVRVLAVYTEGNAETWRRTAPSLPQTWTIAADTACAVKDTPLYDLKAMPTLYLLDADKRVVLKDTSVPALLQYWQAGE